MVESNKARRFPWMPEFVRRILQWIGKHELIVLVVMFLLLGSVWIFIELADEVMEGDTMRFDEWAIRSMRDPNDASKPIGPAWLSEVGRDLTALGGIAFLTMLTAAIAGYLWIRRMYGAMTLVLVATLGGLVVSLLLKSFYDRPRPDLVPHLSITMTSSFPSGHAMLSATVFLTLGALLGRFVREWVLKAYFLVIAVILSVLVGVSRVYMGVHYPTDVLTGWMAGMAWALLCWLIARFMQRQHMVEDEMQAADVDPGPSTR